MANNTQGSPHQELIRSAAKWLMASLGAIGAVLIAGSQLSSIGSLPFGPRLWAAILGLGLGLASVLLAMWKAVSLLTPDPLTLSDLSSQWENANPGPQGVMDKKLRKKYAVVHYLATHREYLGGFDSVPAIKQCWETTSPDDIEEVNSFINKMQNVANSHRLIIDFDRQRVWITGAVLIAALGISVFAWAANPSDNARASLRGADLSGADMSGANLVSADLSGAIFANTNLRGANLREALIDDAVWSNTICPDGTNSDTVARGDTLPGTCAGHLTP